jgi:hypothetical protein
MRAPDFLQSLHSIYPREHYVEQNERCGSLRGRQLTQGILSIFRKFDREALQLKGSLKIIAHLEVVIRDENCSVELSRNDTPPFLRLPSAGRSHFGQRRRLPRFALLERKHKAQDCSLLAISREHLPIVSGHHMPADRNPDALAKRTFAGG